MKGKRLVTLALAAALLAGGVHAAGAELFPAVNPYPGYGDVQETDWFYENAKLCYETGLMTGTDVGFAPALTLSVGQTATIAARIREALTGEAIVRITPAPGQTLPWYAAEVNYLQNAGVTVPDPEGAATRLEFVKLLRAVLPGETLAPINDIAALPDATDGDVLDFYRAGILTGIDGYGTFAGERTLTRSETAAMVSRIVRPALRLSFTPADPAPFTAAGVSPATPFFADGVTAGDYLPTLLSVIHELEAASAQAGVEFNWFNTYGDDTFLAYATQTTLALLGESKDGGLDVYRQFDIQVFYSKYLSLTGEV